MHKYKRIAPRTLRQSLINLGSNTSPAQLGHLLQHHMLGWIFAKLKLPPFRRLKCPRFMSKRNSNFTNAISHLPARLTIVIIGLSFPRAVSIRAKKDLHTVKTIFFSLFCRVNFKFTHLRLSPRKRSLFSSRLFSSNRLFFSHSLRQRG